MSLLLEAGLVRARKGESRIYYTIDREAVAASATPFTRRSCRSSFSDRVIFLPAFGQS